MFSSRLIRSIRTIYSVSPRLNGLSSSKSIIESRNLFTLRSLNSNCLKIQNQTPYRFFSFQPNIFINHKMFSTFKYKGIVKFNEKDIKRHKKQSEIRNNQGDYEGTKEDRRVLRPNQFEVIENELNEKNYLLIRAPPMSGKTTFADYFSERMERNGAIVYHFSQPNPGIKSKEDWDEDWISEFGATFNQIKDRSRKLQNEDQDPENPYKNQIYIVIDEIQRWLGKDYLEPFWDSLRGLRAKNPNIRLLMLGVYGKINSPASPLQIENKIGYEFLRFDFDQIKELANRVQTYGNSHKSFPEEILKQIYHLLGGYPGLTHVLLSYMNKTIEVKNYDKFLQSKEFSNIILGTRTFSWLMNVDSKLSNSTREEFIRYIDECDLKDYSFYVGNQPTENVINFSIRAIWAPDPNSLNNSRYKFTCPVMYEILISKLFAGSMILDENNFQDFIQSTLTMMSPIRLRKSLKDHNDQDPPIEDFLQKEFIIAMTRVLHKDFKYHIRTNGGENSAIDFHINGELNWGIVLVRSTSTGGTKIKEHIERFLPLNVLKSVNSKRTTDGKYFSMNLKKKIIIDFRSIKSSDTKILSIAKKNDIEIWFVKFEKGFFDKNSKLNSFKLRKNDQPEQNVQFHGDENISIID